MDERSKRAQKLYNEIEAALRDVDAKRIEAAGLHEAIAVEELNRGDANGWIDLFAAITHYVDAGRFGRADVLIDAGESFAAKLETGKAMIHHELWKMRDYSADLKKIRKRA